MTGRPLPSEPIVLRASAGADGSPLDHYWSRVVGAGRANEGLRADWQRHLAQARAALLENKLGLLGSPWGLILPFVNGSAPMSVLVLTNAFNVVPPELREAALVDGGSELRIFTTIYLPLARPALVTIALLTAIPTWNEYLLTRVSLSDPSTFTLPIALQNLQSSAVLHYNLLMAGALIVVVPVIILFVMAQRYFVNGLMGR